METKLKSDNLNTIIGFVIGLVGIGISVITGYLSYKVAKEAEKPIYTTVLLNCFILIIIITIILLIGLLFFRYYILQKKQFVKSYRKFNNQKVLSKADLKGVDVKKLTNYDEINSLSRIQNENVSYDFWQSSWFGGECENVQVEDKVNSTVIREANDNGNGEHFAGKVPVTSVIVDGKNKHVLDIKYEHYLGGAWYAAIHGVKGRPSMADWEVNTKDILKSQYVTFFARAPQTKVPPTADKNNISRCPLIYVRFEDSGNKTSNLVVVKVPTEWEYFEIPLYKFIHKPELYYDWQMFTEEKAINELDQFRPDKVMQIMFGNSERMPSQAGSLQIRDISLK
ncbi:hypothetical protein [Fibrella forsythiae]|uniref:Uncharacterized protein n=1 Tax=Fibrella forsythiae TaxID=2817061 RepID=A0ABS3JN16_9BACT|nr:hypothetical protein [Fibrella forsythiae]MBO0950594.1 hypothetical protein [Fibrella forsythiae]